MHIDITEMRIEKQKFYLFVAIDRVTKYAYVELHERMTQEVARDFLQAVIDDFPYVIHRVLTDNGSQFTYALLAEHLRPKGKKHMFDVLCEKHGIEHRLTKFRHPWTNGQVEIMNKKIKNHTTKIYHYEDVESLKKHLMAYLLAYNFQRPLKALKYISPYDSVLQWYEKRPDLFLSNPHHKKAGLNTRPEPCFCEIWLAEQSSFAWSRNRKVTCYQFNTSRASCKQMPDLGNFCMSL